MSPESFLKRPIRWLAAITRYRGTRGGAPNFAYDECVRTTTEEQRAALDLSSWRIAYTGSEPVRWDSLERFYAAFAATGLRRTALRPAYGLAEATLCVATTPLDEGPQPVQLDQQALGEFRIVPAQPSRRSQTFVECGRALKNTRIEIVDPVSGSPCPSDRIGEIWLSGTSVCRRYWKQDNESIATFGARLAQGDESTFLRTGDLGFLRGDRLVVTGRLKDLIVVAGRNIHPHDIEHTVLSLPQGAQALGCVAFSVDDEQTERLVVVVGVGARQRGVTRSALTTAVRSAVASEHDIAVSDLVFVRNSAIPRTSSGKVRRQHCRAQYLAGELPRFEWQEGADVQAHAECTELSE